MMISVMFKRMQWVVMDLDCCFLVHLGIDHQKGVAQTAYCAFLKVHYTLTQRAVGDDANAKLSAGWNDLCLHM